MPVSQISKARVRWGKRVVFAMPDEIFQLKAITFYFGSILTIYPVSGQETHMIFFFSFSLYPYSFCFDLYFYFSELMHFEVKALSFAK